MYRTRRWRHCHPCWFTLRSLFPFRRKTESQGLLGLLLLAPDATCDRRLKSANQFVMAFLFPERSSRYDIVLSRLHPVGRRLALISSIKVPKAPDMKTNWPATEFLCDSHFSPHRFSVQCALRCHSFWTLMDELVRSAFISLLCI